MSDVGGVNCRYYYKNPFFDQQTQYENVGIFAPGFPFIRTMEKLIYSIGPKINIFGAVVIDVQLISISSIGSWFVVHRAYFFFPILAQ